MADARPVADLAEFVALMSVEVPSERRAPSNKNFNTRSLHSRSFRGNMERAAHKRAKLHLLMPSVNQPLKDLTLKDKICQAEWCATGTKTKNNQHAAMSGFLNHAWPHSRARAWHFIQRHVRWLTGLDLAQALEASVRATPKNIPLLILKTSYLQSLTSGMDATTQHVLQGAK